MNRLPDELLACIAECRDYSSQKTLRFVNNTWDDLCTPLVFEHAYIALFDHSLSKFHNLASSKLSKHVKKVTFYCDVLPNYTRTEWEKNVDLCRGHLYSYKNDVNAEWDAYRDLVHEQQGWQHCQQGKAFETSIQGLRNLREVRAIQAVPGDVEANQWPIWKRLTKECIVGPDQWKLLSDESPTAFVAYDTDGRAALALLEAMGRRVSCGLPAISSLQLQLFCQNFYFIKPLRHHKSGQPVPPTWVNSVRPLLRIAFANLTELSLYLQTPYKWGLFGGILVDISDFLYKAKQLRSLRFWFEYSEDFAGTWGDDNSLLTDQIGFYSDNTVVLPSIEHLALKINIPAKKLLRFLELHSGTLRSLELRHMLVQDVPLFVEGIPKVTILDEVYVQGLWHHGQGSRKNTSLMR